MQPYLEINIQLLPGDDPKRVIIGPDNCALHCPDAKESWEQARSGEVVLDHRHQALHEGDRISGHFKLGSGHTERADCPSDRFAP
jgi:hypothetical protein